MATYTAATIAAMNARGQALLDPNKAKPPTPTSGSAYYASQSTPSATTLGRSGSQAGYPTGTYNPPAGTAPLGNQKVNSTSGSSSSGSSSTNRVQQEVIEQEKPSWLSGDVPSSTGQQGISQSYEDLRQALLKSTVAGLEKRLGNSLANLDNQQADIAPYFYDKRNQAAAASDISALNFAQRAAARGISGNAANMPEIYRENALQGRIGALDQAEASENARIERDRTNLRNNFEADLVAAQAGIEATALSDYINTMKSDREFALDEAALTGIYNGRITPAGQAQQIDNAKAQLELDAMAIKNSYLPQTLKDEAELLRQQVQAGRIDVSTAAARLNQIKRSATGSSGMTSSEVYKALENNLISEEQAKSMLGL